MRRLRRTLRFLALKCDSSPRDDPDTILPLTPPPLPSLFLSVCMRFFSGTVIFVWPEQESIGIYRRGTASNGAVWPRALSIPDVGARGCVPLGHRIRYTCGYHTLYAPSFDLDGTGAGYSVFASKLRPTDRHEETPDLT